MLKKNEIKKNIFSREIAMCAKLYNKKKGCHWGKCDNCGVIPLLVKLNKGILMEDKKEIKKFKDKIFANS